VRRKNLFLVTGRCLSSVVTAIGGFLLTLAVVAVFEGWFFQWSGQRELENLRVASGPVHAVAPPPKAEQKRRPARGVLLARLEIPRVKMSVVVLEGSDDIVLKRGPGHIEETAFPGELGNVGIAGHRDTHFRSLRNVRANDEITLTDKNNVTMRYFIDSIQITHPTDMQILDPTPGPALTLVTCYPFEFIGNAPMRFIVRATPRAGTGANSTYAAR
jgi:sortase A